jgi:conjugative relaxase-like TrwC/TraI family protein
MRMMGADSVAYHRETIIERGDDFPGAGLEYYASRGETPLLWSGMGAESLGLVGPVDNPSYDALYGPGGARDPVTGERLVNSRRPGMELVIAAHKSVAELGVLGRVDDMHAIMDAERDATLAYLDQLTRERGGRRGVAAVPTATTGLVYAHARHATTRAGDPGPHDHVLMANVIEMLDEKGGTKAPDTTLWREHLHAATMVGRVASAATAVELGYGIEAYRGPSGKLGHWKICGIPDKALAVHSKRAQEINVAVAEKGFDSYQARQVAARETRKAKRHTPVEELLPRWRKELTDAGFPPEQLVADIEHAGVDYRREHSPTKVLWDKELAELTNDVLGPHGTLSDRKVFSRRDVIVAVAPRVFGLPARELEKATERVLRDPDAIPLIGVPRASERAFATAHVLATEQAIERAVERGVENLGAARVTSEVADDAMGRQSAVLGSPLTPGQQAAVMGIATSGRGVELVEGVAGSGKTTVMAAVRDAFESGGFTVIGTSTSGQAARTLGREAGLTESRTLTSLRWRIQHERMHLTEGHVLVLDEAGMAGDRDIAFLLDHARMSGAKVVMVGDDRQLGAVSVGGAMGALIERHGGIVHVLQQNVRQHNQAEQEALAELRAGEVTRAVEFYLEQDRVTTERTRDETLHKLVDQWANDALAGRDVAMFAWRRANVAELNRLARERMVEEGRVTGPEVVAPGGTRFAAGDRIVTLAPLAHGQIVTSERGVVIAVGQDQDHLMVRLENGREHRLERREIGADQLAHGYATTVHRSQGATHDLAHVYEDAGGRELAYVAMSRARDGTQVYLCADDLDQARVDLCHSWATERRWKWAIDTGTPEVKGRESQPTAPVSLEREAIKQEQAGLYAALPRYLRDEIQAARGQCRDAEAQLSRLRSHNGTHWGGAITEAGHELYAAQRVHSDHQWYAHSFIARMRARLAKSADLERIAEAQEKLDKLRQPEEPRLLQACEGAEEELADLLRESTDGERWRAEHPEVIHRMGEIGGQIYNLHARVDSERRDVDKELNPRPEPERSLERSSHRDHSSSNQHDRAYGFGM